MRTLYAPLRRAPRSHPTTRPRDEATLTADRLRTTSTVATLAIVALILVGTLLPAGAGGGARPFGLPSVVGHFALFAALGVPLAARFATSAAARPHPRVALLAVLAAVALFAALDELAQIAIEGRDADPFDWLADVVGVVLGMIGGSALLRRVLEGRGGY